MNLLRPADYQQLKWKNGQGVTAEIAIDPPGCDFAKAPFLWRLSSARVEQGGPFSQFPGYDRFLTVVSGQGLKLRIDSEANEKTLSVGDVQHFSGEACVTCELQAGAITDLNLIYRRDRIKTLFQVLETTAQELLVSAKSETTWVFVISQTLMVADSQTGQSYTVQAGETMRLTKGESLRLNAPVAARFALIEIDPIKSAPAN